MGDSADNPLKKMFQKITKKFDPESADDWLNLALEQDQKGKPREAVVSYEQFLLLAPDEYIKVMFHTQMRLHALGVADIAADIRGLNSEAMKKEKPGPHLARSWYNKGRCFLRLGKHEDAIHCFDESLKSDPGLLLAWQGRARSLQLLGRHKEAIACDDQILALDPRDGNAWFSKGESLSSLGRCEDAIQCFDQALIYEPRGFLAWLSKGEAEEKLGLIQEAIHSYRQVVEIAPENRPVDLQKARQRLQELESR